MRTSLAALFATLLVTTSGSSVASLLDQVEKEQLVSVPGFAYAPGKSFTAAVHLRRIEVYAEDARVWVQAADGMREISRSDLQLFVGDPEREPQRLYLAVSADGSRFEGAIFDFDGTHAIQGRVLADQLIVERSERVEDRGGEFTCGGSPLASHPKPADPQQATAPESRDQQVQGNPTHQALVAVDTDNEFMNLKFSNNQTDANNYIAALFAGMNVFYERDLATRLAIGTVVLRPSTTPDPYTIPGGTPGSPGNPLTNIDEQLDEFGEFWRTTQQAVPRAFATMLSGKSGAGNEFFTTGLAWVLNAAGSNYCAATGTVVNNETQGHYSLTRVFRFNGATAANDVSIVGHELGHNFGALHTHCSSSVTGGPGTNAGQLIDRCFNAEQAGGGIVCHSGALACPTDNSISGRGSVMSYCNFGAPSGANCGAVLQEFHPAHQTFLGTRKATNVANGCFTAIAGNVGPQIAANTPANMSTTNLGGGTIGTQRNGSITFTTSGGSGAGTTQLTCSVGSGTVSVVSGSPQTVSVGGSAGPVGVRFTLTASAQSGVVNCSAVRQGAGTTNFTYTFTVPAGTTPSLTKIFCSGFESGQTGVCS